MGVNAFEPLSAALAVRVACLRSEPELPWGGDVGVAGSLPGAVLCVPIAGTRAGGVRPRSRDPQGPVGASGTHGRRKSVEDVRGPRCAFPVAARSWLSPAGARVGRRPIAKRR